MLLPAFVNCYLHVKRRVHAVNIFLIDFFTEQLNRFTKTLEMDDLSFPEEFDYIVNIRVVRESKNIIISHAGLLLCCNFVKTTALKNPVFMRVFGIGIFG